MMRTYASTERMAYAPVDGRLMRKMREKDDIRALALNGLDGGGAPMRAYVVVPRS